MGQPASRLGLFVRLIRRVARRGSLYLRPFASRFRKVENPSGSICPSHSSSSQWNEPLAREAVVGG